MSRFDLYTLKQRERTNRLLYSATHVEVEIKRKNISSGTAAMRLSIPIIYVCPHEWNYRSF